MLFVVCCLLFVVCCLLFVQVRSLFREGISYGEYGFCWFSSC